LQVDVKVAAPAKTAAGQPVVAPGGKSSITVKVADAGGAPAPNAEVTLIAVDKAVLDLMPYPIQVR
jgi:uncharacterized protein YfaS (alpha-2-macroglobulin family)